MLATADKDGTARVGRVSSGEPHLLVGHKGVVERVAISPDLRWVSSTGDDNTLRLWPMPDLDEPPLHALPHGELLAKLRSLTNLRAVRDPKSSTGWTIEVGPFPGWKNIPSWRGGRDPIERTTLAKRPAGPGALEGLELQPAEPSKEGPGRYHEIRILHVRFSW